MKHKRIAALILAVLMMFALTMTVCAEDEIEETAETVEEAVEEAATETVESAPETTKAPAVEAEDETTWTEQAAQYLAEMWPAILTALAAVYAAFPKWGGIALLYKAFKKIQSYFDDKNNVKSVYNVLSANSDMISRFLNDIYPVLAELKDQGITLKDLVDKVRGDADLQTKLIGFIKAANETAKVNAKTVQYLLEVSPNVNEKRRAEIMADITIEQRNADNALKLLEAADEKTEKIDRS